MAAGTGDGSARAHLEREEGLRDRGALAYGERRYREALDDFQASALAEALRWLREEGFAFQEPDGPAPTELLVSWAIAANAILRDQGESASEKLLVATCLISAMAEVRLALTTRGSPSTDGRANEDAELLLRGLLLGEVGLLMNMIRMGWTDRLKAHEIATIRRRAGADATNLLKRSVRERALAGAHDIVRVNPTLSNEELATKVRAALGLDTSIRTMTQWVREWRRNNHLPPQKHPGR